MFLAQKIKIDMVASLHSSINKQFIKYILPIHCDFHQALNLSPKIYLV